MHYRVFIAVIAILMSIFGPLTLSHAGRPAIAAVSEDPHTPSLPYSVYLYMDGEPVDVTAQAAYNEDHVFYLGSYVGDRAGTNGETILRDGLVVGYLDAGL